MIATIAIHFNPCNWKRPVFNWNLFMNQSAIKERPVYGFWAKYGNEDYKLSNLYLEVQASSILFQKEAMINRIAQDVLSSNKKITSLAFIDADILFENEFFLQDAEDRLKDKKVVQLFSKCKFMDRNFSLERTCPSCLSVNLNRQFSYARVHPGFAWAARRELWTELGGLYDRAIVGGGDGLLHLAITGEWKTRHEQPPLSFNKKSRDHFQKWAKKVDEWVNGDYGYITGTVKHLWHGERKDRQYENRNDLMLGFDPENHVKLNSDGLLDWQAGADPRLVSYLTRYFQNRKED